MLKQYLNSEYDYDVRDLGFYRVLFASLVVAGFSRYVWIVELQSFMFSPPMSLTALWTDFPPVFVTFGFVSILAASTTCLLFGFWPRSASLILSIAWLAVHSVAFSTGKINHGILMQVAPFVLAFSSWGNSFRLKECKETNELRDGFPVAIFAFLTAFWMATAGWHKLTHNWLDTSFSAVFVMVYSNAVVTDRATLVGQFSLEFLPQWAWEFNDWITVLFELSGILFVWKRKYFRCWLFAACFFHLGIDLFMAIPYSPALIAYAAFVPWSRLSFVRWLHTKRSRRVTLLISVFCIALTATAVNAIWPSDFVSRSIVWTAPVMAIIFAIQDTSRFSHVEGRIGSGNTM